ncbi:hypothetical protein [Moraxella marmotae]|uniref:hypothetical protein n=1 Tax=Moraxella marmotae TaxID=3344520 RepID=UPI0035F3D8D8
MILLTLTHYYMVIFGIFWIFTYLKLIVDVFFKKPDEKNRKLINILSYFSVPTSITLFLFMVLEFFDDNSGSFFIYIVQRNILYGTSFVLSWFMPLIFLLIRKYIIHHGFYIKFSVVWYGVIVLCLALRIFNDYRGLI